MSKDLSNYRDKYLKGELIEKKLPKDPFDLFDNWFEDLEKFGNERENNAMSLTTVNDKNVPTTRVVLLKQFSKNGFVFYTNYDSRKGKHIDNNPNVCISFYWPSMERQVIINGKVSKISAIESDKYFNSRPKSSQLGAIISNQSEIIPSRKFLEEKLSKFNISNNNLNRPSNWGGYILKPELFEFWQGRDSRLHDRIIFSKSKTNWDQKRLSP
ncbi:MAG: pyridoxamine 5'-phosphate oxidase [Flavobacteriaceae bacterium]|jgi:pyridoxamine 5'-phosphate oxidase|nr:pyridoxamine 5'-phosphate oxidase [Flavobacteriaceae bacterium]